MSVSSDLEAWEMDSQSGVVLYTYKELKSIQSTGESDRKMTGTGRHVINIGTSSGKTGG